MIDIDEVIPCMLRNERRSQIQFLYRNAAEVLPVGAANEFPKFQDVRAR